MEELPFEGDVEITDWHRSEKIGQLVKALATAHLKFEVLKKERENPFYKSKYADLAAGIDASVKALSENELTLFQFPLISNGRAGVTTLLAHSSDEWVSCDLLLKMVRDDPQGSGATITFARRYAREAILDMSGEVDDDGNLASGKQEKVIPQPPPPKPKPQRTPGQQFWATARATGHQDKEIDEYIKTLTPDHSEHASRIPAEKREEAMKWAETAPGLPFAEVFPNDKS
jgi:hypothetical protein